MSAPSERERLVRDAFRAQAEACGRLGSPFTAQICAILAEGLDRESAIGQEVLDWPGIPDAFHDALPLRFAGGLNALVRRGHLPALAALYPPQPRPREGALRPVLLAAVASGGAELAAWLRSPPQTNEVARSAVLMAGYLGVAAETRLPLSILELGASAGLNLLADRYRCTLGTRVVGPPDSPVHLAPAWTGPDPPDAPIRVAARRGVDLNPLDATRAQDRERLLAYVWPDQRERVARIDAALVMAAADPPSIDRADAGAWLDDRLAGRAGPGLATVVAHSIAFQYFPAAVQDRIAAKIERVGAAATSNNPLAWLRYEADPEFGGLASLRLRLWPGGRDRLLALADAHARSVEWRA